MVKIKPKIILDRNEKKVGTIITITEFRNMIDELEDYYEYESIKKRINKKEKTYTRKEAMNELLGKK